MKRRRSGFTLVEMVLVIGLTSIVLGTIGVMLHGAFRLQRSMTDHRELVDVVARLADQFRADVHAANLVDTAGKQCVVTLPDQKQIEYRADQGGISRTVRSGAQVLHRDTYFVPGEFTVHGTVEPGDTARPAGRQVVSLLVGLLRGESATDVSAPTREFRIDAVVGLLPGERRDQGGSP